jgi:hypothetical protein
MLLIESSARKGKVTVATEAVWIPKLERRVFGVEHNY